MYREPLDDNAALNILGDDYNAGHSYFLISDRDQFVIYDVDEKGSLFNEIRLEETPYETSAEDTSIEELFGVSIEEHTTTTSKLKVVNILFWVIFGLIMALVVAVVLFILK